MRVLVVDDEVLLAEALQEVLTQEGYEARTAASAEAGLALVRLWAPDLILLDIALPGGMSGFDLLRALRRDSDVPVILLSGRGGEADKVLGLEYADDYVVKPVGGAELVARVRALMRRAAPRARPEASGAIEVGALYVNLTSCEVALAGMPLSLTPTEFRILSVLAGQPGRVFSRDVLMARIWGEDAHVHPHTLDVHIRGLRRKLEPDPSSPVHIVTVRGMGFRYVP